MRSVSLLLAGVIGGAALAAPPATQPTTQPADMKAMPMDCMMMGKHASPATQPAAHKAAPATQPMAMKMMKGCMMDHAPSGAEPTTQPAHQHVH